MPIGCTATSCCAGTLTPSAAFQQQPAAAANAYAAPDMWLARPDRPGNPALWLPAGLTATPPGAAAVFFIHPTSYLDKSRWNAPLDDADANGRAALFLRGQASAFSAAGQIWAPRYRQATFGAFLTDATAAGQALDLAYRDVDAAFTEFLKQAGDRPLILAGHSQGALHLSRLLRDRVADTRSRSGWWRPMSSAGRSHARSTCRAWACPNAPGRTRPAASCPGKASANRPIRR